MSLSSLRSASKGGLSKLASDLEKLNQNNFAKDDENFWKPEVDKNGNGYAILRFLPAPEGEDTPYVRYWDHSFSRNGKWYIEMSRTTLGEADPCAEYNSELWNSGVDANKKLVQGSPAEEIIGSKRRLHYVANILVIHDSANPSNNGRVFKYRFGQKIFDKVKEAVKPPFPNQPPINPFCFWEGADFELKIRKVAGYRNYDSSQFKGQSELFNGNEDQLEEVYRSLHSLSEIIAPDKFKSYEDLQKRLNLVLGKGAAPAPAAARNEVEEEIPAPRRSPMERPSAAAPAAKAEKAPWEDDDDDAFFSRLRKEEE